MKISFVKRKAAAGPEEIAAELCFAPLLCNAFLPRISTVSTEFRLCLALMFYTYFQCIYNS